MPTTTHIPSARPPSTTRRRRRSTTGPGKEQATFRASAFAVAVAIALLVAGCAAAAPPAEPSPTPSSPAATSPASPSGSPPGTVTSPEQAAEAVARVDSNFLGYTQRDPDLIGQSAWFEAKAVPGGFELTFFRGAGDCPAGCIERSFIKFFVARDGSVEKRCEWQEGNGSKATPC